MSALQKDNDLQNSGHKTKDWVTQTPLNNLCDIKCIEVAFSSVLLVAPVVLVFLQSWWQVKSLFIQSTKDEIRKNSLNIGHLLFSFKKEIREREKIKNKKERKTNKLKTK